MFLIIADFFNKVATSRETIYYENPEQQSCKSHAYTSVCFNSQSVFTESDTPG